jgi:Ser/Thr protein kinase RdoA (MazF antagonist)
MDVPPSPRVDAHSPGTADEISPVVRSVASPPAVVQLVRTLWSLDARKAVLIRSLVNDLWRVTAQEQYFALKVYRAGRWSVNEVAWEQDLARLLRAEGLTDAEPVPLADGRLAGTVLAPEGGRPVVLTTWAAAPKPRPPFDDALYAEFGTLAARFHAAAAAMSSVHGARVFTLESVLTAPAVRVGRALHGLSRHADAVMVVERADRAQGELLALMSAGLRHGVRHGDVSLDNVLMTNSGLTLHDFDLSGHGWPAADLVGALSTPHSAAFLEGYETIRPLQPVERRALPHLRVAELVRNLDFHLTDKAAIRGIESVGEGWVDAELAALRDHREVYYFKQKV